MALLVFISEDAAVAAAAAAHIGGHQIGAQKRRQRVGAAHRAHLRAALKERGIDEADLCKKYKVEELFDLTKNQLDHIFGKMGIA